MDTDTESRLRNLEQRMESLENLVTDAGEQFKSALGRLESHPIFGSVIRMLRD